MKDFNICENYILDFEEVLVLCFMDGLLVGYFINVVDLYIETVVIGIVKQAVSL